MGIWDTYEARLGQYKSDIPGETPLRTVERNKMRDRIRRQITSTLNYQQVKLGDKYFAETADISAPELGKIKDFILTDGKSTYIMGYCPLTYCGKAIKSDKETLVNIGYTMQEYYEASRTYFNLYK